MDLQKYRKSQLSELTNDTGVYALCDIDEIPIYLGQSVDGIRTRVQRHLTSARSDVIANRQVDVWEIGYVWAWPLPKSSKPEISAVEHYLINQYHEQQSLMNGSIPESPNFPPAIPKKQIVRVLPEEEIKLRKDPTLRLPRQAAQFNNLFSYILEVKNNKELRRTLTAHFDRLSRYYNNFIENHKD